MSVVEEIRIALRHYNERYYERQQRQNDASYSERVAVKDEDVPFLPEPTERVELMFLGACWNTVMCWPSVGGIIINTQLTPVELDFLKLPRFLNSPRSNNPSEEDEFCRQLHKTGGKWWQGYWDYDSVVSVMRGASAAERLSLITGWPEDGGVWVMMEGDWRNFGGEAGFWRMRNAYTMDERCRAMEMAGAIYYKNPEDCISLRPFLEDFGEHERGNSSEYYYDHEIIGPRVSRVGT